MIDIRKNNKEELDGRYTVCVDAEGNSKIFLNRNDEYILNERFSIIARATTYKEAIKALRRFQYRNINYIVISSKVNGVEKLKLRKFEGVINNAPIGTIGVFKRRRDAKKFMTKKNMLAKSA